MTAKHRQLGGRYDGGEGLRPASKIDIGDYGVAFRHGTCSLDESTAIHVGAPGQWSASVQTDYEAILAGTVRELSSAWCNQQLTSWGYTAEIIRGMPERKRMLVCDKLVRAARRTQTQKHDDVLGMLLGNTEGRGDALRAERTRLHEDLAANWARGELRLEHPQGSSYHHMVNYEARVARETGEIPVLVELPSKSRPQIFVVERDWARAFSGYDFGTSSDVPTPFPFCCFEFRISGVRVLAFYDESGGAWKQRPDNTTTMWMMYGRDGTWCVDDAEYDVGDGVTTRRWAARRRNLVDFPRVARLVQDNVRVACIMVDADLATRETRSASPSLVKKLAGRGRTPPRDHYVIDLKRSHRPAHLTARSAGASVCGRSPQRGHFRRGSWVHYDDPDSGSTQYVDAGGFWHSRTWRRWHFAGDPNNLIEREYLL